MVKRFAVFGFGLAIGVVLLVVLRQALDGGASEPVALSVEGRASSTPSIDADGEVVAIAWSGTGANGGADVFASISTNGGRSFAPAVRVNDGQGTARVSGETGPRVAVRAREGQPAEVHVLWTAKESDTTIRLARSNDGGRTFAGSQPLQMDGAVGDRGWAALALDRGGRPAAVWLDHRDMASGGEAHHHGHDVAAPGAAPVDGVAMAQKSAIYFAGGAGEHAIARGVCYCCKTAIDRADDGQLFVAWRHVYPGNMRDIAVSSSSDGGASFSPPVRVSQDQWQIDGCPDDGPALSLGPDGVLHLAWPTVVAQPAPHKAVFYATSRDGHAFSPRVRVSPEGRNAAHPQIAVGPEGRVAALWDEIMEGKRRVFLSRLEDGRFSEPRVVSDAATDAAASYPVAVFSGDTLVAAWVQGPPESSAIAVRLLTH
jgi:hypothetical protein